MARKLNEFETKKMAAMGARNQGNFNDLSAVDPYDDLEEDLVSKILYKTARL